MAESPIWSHWETLGVEAVLFDFDGVFVDALETYRRATSLAVAQLLDDNDALKTTVLETINSYYESTQPANLHEILYSLLASPLGFAPCDAAAFYTYLDGKKHSCLSELAKSGSIGWLAMEKFVREVVRRNWKHAICTANSAITVELLFKHSPAHAAFAHKTFPIITTEQVSRQKPDPTIWLKTASLLGVCPRAAIVIDDNAEVVESALRAGFGFGIIPGRKLRVGDRSIEVESLDDLIPLP